MNMRSEFRRTALLCLLALWCAPHCVEAADRPDAGWRQTAVLVAPEAVQAAAADEKHVYAIANAAIAKYDRETGRRLAVSTGPAKHLNSGFFRKGRLYAAHSNYPRVPEQSEIKVLDPESMRLATFHDFGDFGGSLTWCVRRDDAWRETGRWTYPPEVIRKLGQYSLSGGIWQGDDLFVTGHDDPIVFQLRLPGEGSVLELVAECRVPFTGQGIAADPKTGGLVGIHRAKRQIVFAEKVRDDPRAGNR